MFSLPCHVPQRGNKQSTITKYFQSATAAERRKRCNLVYDDDHSSSLQSEKKRKFTPGTTSFDEMEQVVSSSEQSRLAGMTCIAEAEQKEAGSCELSDEEGTSANDSLNASQMKMQTNEEKNEHQNVGQHAMEASEIAHAHEIDETNAIMDTSMKDALATVTNPIVKNAVLQSKIRSLPILQSETANLPEEKQGVLMPKSGRSKGSARPQSHDMRNGNISDTSNDSSNDSLDLNKYISSSGAHQTKKQLPSEQPKLTTSPAMSKNKPTAKHLAKLSLDTTVKKSANSTLHPGRKNIDFYSNKIASSPNGAKIEDLLRTWKGDYRKLEQHHGYIQWLFPIPEQGLNSQAQPLTPAEAHFLQTDDVANDRLMRSYRLMLDFFGMALVEDEDFTLRRAKNWKERYSNLNSSHHNYLRITRILKCLHEVGLCQVQISFIRFLVKEVFIEKTLTSGQRSCREFWLPTVADMDTRHELAALVKSSSKVDFGESISRYS